MHTPATASDLDRPSDSRRDGPRPGRSRVRLAVAVGVAALAAVAVVVVTQTRDNQPAAPPGVTPAALDGFAADCFASLVNTWPELEWGATAGVTDGKVGAVTVRGHDEFAICEGLPRENGSLALGSTYRYRGGPDQVPEPSAAPNLWLKPFGADSTRPPRYSLILRGLVSSQARGMILTLSDGSTVEAEVADEAAVGLVRWDGGSVSPEGTEDLIVSVRVVGMDGVVLYEGPPA